MEDILGQLRLYMEDTSCTTVVFLSRLHYRNEKKRKSKEILFYPSFVSLLSYEMPAWHIVPSSCIFLLAHWQLHILLIHTERS